MTVLDFFKNNDAETIANQIMYNDTVKVAFDIHYNNCYFREDKECPMECEYLEKYNEYECECFNGMCINNNELCPYGIDRDKVVKKQVLEWLQSDIDKI